MRSNKTKANQDKKNNIKLRWSSLCAGPRKGQFLVLRRGVSPWYEKIWSVGIIRRRRDVSANLGCCTACTACTDDGTACTDGQWRDQSGYMLEERNGWSANLGQAVRMWDPYTWPYKVKLHPFTMRTYPGYSLQQPSLHLIISDRWEGWGTRAGQAGKVWQADSLSERVSTTIGQSLN